MKLLYIASSSYSGSTLLSFLLNVHPEISTVGEMDGWNYGPNQTFNCSCGETLGNCPLFRIIGQAFRESGLPFDPREFGTAYRVAENDRLNRYLTRGLPFLTTTSLEALRDGLVGLVPRFSHLLARQDRANLTFIETALRYARASVFVDACKDPFRLRHLRRIGKLDIHVLHLVRDLRGVVFSNLELNRPGCDATGFTKMWIKQQVSIDRIAREFPHQAIHYEDLCDATEPTLSAVYRFVGLRPCSIPGDFRSVEHHIIGNRMRLSNTSKITRNERWKTELSKPDLEAIERAADGFVRKNKAHPVAAMIMRYLYNDRSRSTQVSNNRG